VIDELEPMIAEGGVILDWHTCEVFPERWVDLVVVLRCNHSMLWERLEKRCVYPSSIYSLLGRSPHLPTSEYPLKKIQENNMSEIMGVVLDEAREAYAEEIVVELQSETVQDMESNVARIVRWIENWQNDSAA
jgi:adenylate kinase